MDGSSDISYKADDNNSDECELYNIRVHDDLTFENIYHVAIMY